MYRKKILTFSHFHILPVSLSLRPPLITVKNSMLIVISARCGRSKESFAKGGNPSGAFENCSGHLAGME